MPFAPRGEEHGDQMLTREQLLSAGVSDEHARRFIDARIAAGEVGHLLVRPEGGDRVVLAYDGDVPLVVDSGPVFALDGTRRLVNSDLSAFLDVLRRYQAYVTEVAEAGSDEDGEKIARAAADEMQRLDPEAFENDVGYWPIVCAQMIEGNL